MRDYGFFLRESFAASELGLLGSYDVLLSAFNLSERVSRVFSAVAASEAVWLIHPEYALSASERPRAARSLDLIGDEVEGMSMALDSVGAAAGVRLAIDITGMMRTHVAALLWILAKRDIKQCDVIYAEPASYAKQERTAFTMGSVSHVRAVMGFEGVHNTDTSRDYVILGPGFDLSSILHTAEHKRSARRVVVLGLPSLRPDMYQQNVLAAKGADGSLQPIDGIRFAPANDPFATADVVAGIVDHMERRNPATNLYLCPLSTKPQVLGFAFYHLRERMGGPTTLLQPVARRYSKETSRGIARVWRYRVELPSLS